MAFDPKAYLAGGGTQGKAKKFDPKAYLGAKPAPDLPRLNPHTGMPLDTSPDKVTAADLETDANSKGGRTGHGESMPSLADASPARMMRYQESNMTPEDKRQARNEKLVAGAGLAGGMALPALLAAGGVGAGLAGGSGLAFRLGAAGLSSAAGGEAAGATRAALEGKTAAETLQAASDEGLTAAAVGGPLHLAGEGGGALVAGARKGGSWLARYMRAKDAGVYKTPEMQALPEGPEGINQAAYEAHKRISTKMQANRTALEEEYKATLNPLGSDYTPPDDNPLFAAAAARNRPQRLLEALPDDRLPTAPFPRERPPGPAPEPPGPPRRIEGLPSGPRQLGPVSDRGARYEVTPGGRVRRPGAAEAKLPPGAREAGGEGGQLEVIGERGMGRAQGLPRAEQEYIPAPDESVSPPPKGPETHNTRPEASGVSYEAPEAPPAAEAPGRTPVAAGLGRDVDREALIRSLRAQKAKNISKSTGRPFNREVDDAIDAAIADLGPDGTKIDVAHVLGQRHALGERANFGSPNATTVDKANQKAYHALRSAVREAAPDTVAPADDLVSEGLRKHARARDIIYKSDAEVLPPPGQEPVPGGATEPSDVLGAPVDESPEAAQMAVLKEQQGVRNIERIGDTASKPGREYQRYLEELAAQDPEFAAALDFVGAKSGYEATRFGGGHMPTHFTGATQLGGIPRFLHQNANAARATLDPVARALSLLKRIAPLNGTVADQLLNAKAEAKGKDKKRADALGSR